MEKAKRLKSLNNSELVLCEEGFRIFILSLLEVVAQSGLCDVLLVLTLQHIDKMFNIQMEILSLVKFT